MPATQENHQISVTSPLAPDKLLFRSMTTEEGLGRLPEFRVQLLSDDPSVRIADVLGQPMGVALELVDGAQRHFHGIVTRFGSVGHVHERAAYEALVHPWLWLLKKSSNCRIFQDMKVTDIVKAVCASYGGVAALSFSGLTETYPVLNYCVQYRESDFDFVCRLLDDAGIYFYFTYSADSHTMVLADNHLSHVAIPGYDGLKYSAGGPGSGLHEETLWAWSASGQIESSSYMLNDFNLEKSGASVRGGLVSKAQIEAGFKQAAYEMYDYPGRYAEVSDGNLLAKARMQRLHGQCEAIDAVTDARGLFAGGLFTLDAHPREDQNRQYLITGADYQISGGGYASNGGAGLDVVCRLHAVGHQTAYRPPVEIARPVVHGPQTAMVVGKAGEEIWTDKYGRVKVQFHWDRQGHEDEKSSCWVRVAQGWAGKGWGTMSIPRVGMEVVVSFLEGDPDRPLVTGCVYNSDAMPPYALPAEQTKSTIKSNSTKGGSGYNELRFEDKKGAEEVYVQAERDFLRVVKNNDTLKVGFETADQGDQDIAIKHDRLLKVGNNETITIGKDQGLAIDGNQKVKAGQTIVIEAGTSIELKVGSSSIKIEPAKITIKSVQIEIAADAGMEAKAGAIMELKATLVKIN